MRMTILGGRVGEFVYVLCFADSILLLIDYREKPLSITVTICVLSMNG
jgi:hypothetical protein